MCLKPLKMFVYHDCVTGELRRTFKLNLNLNPDEVLTLPCGKCFECVSQYSTEWSYRIMLECSLHKYNYMVTLTYADVSRTDGQLCKRDLQLFLKKLRKHFAFRYFACGEYGSKGQRPHYHLILFSDYELPLERFFVRDGHYVYKCDFLAHIWSYGFISVEDVTLDSAKYCAKYLQKFSPLPDGFVKPFTIMSLKPGIGYQAFDPSWVSTDKLYVNGKSIPIPRYYLRKIENDVDLSQLRAYRVRKSEFMNSQILTRRNRAKKVLQKFGKKYLTVHKF